MRPYASLGKLPDFEVEYRFLSEQEGGRKHPPVQHLRTDFLYEGDQPQRDGIWMIHPEFLDSSGNPWPDGPVPGAGAAHMFILNPEMWETHKKRIKLGTKAYLVEGPKRVAECTVTKLIGLSDDRSGRSRGQGE